MLQTRPWIRKSDSDNILVNKSIYCNLSFYFLQSVKLGGTLYGPDAMEFFGVELLWNDFDIVE